MEGYVTPTGMCILNSRPLLRVGSSPEKSMKPSIFLEPLQIYISAFFNIMKQIRPYQLTSWTEEHLIALAQVFNKGHNVNFAFFQAFNNLMKNMELGRFTQFI